MLRLPTGRMFLALLVVVIILVANVAVSAVIYTSVDSLKLPKTRISLDVIDLTSQDAVIGLTLEIENPNSFEMSLQNLSLAVVKDLTELARITVDGGAVPSHANRTFASQHSLHLSSSPRGLLSSTLTGTVGISLFGVMTKTLPLTVTIVTNLEDIIERIHVPTVTVATTIGTLTASEVDFSADITVDNANSFDLLISDLAVIMTTDTNTEVGSLSVPGGTIPGNGSATFPCDGHLLLAALNAKTLTLSVSATAGATIANVTETIPLRTTVSIVVPSLETLIPKDKPLELTMAVDMALGRGGLVGHVNLSVFNPTAIPLVAEDLRVDYYVVDAGKRIFVSTGNLTGGEIPSNVFTSFTGDIVFPLGAKPSSDAPWLPDMLFARLNVNLSVSGINQSLWVGLGSFVDVRPFRISY